MSTLQAALAAYAARDGRAYRLPNLRHRHLVDTPIAMVAFQLGGEPFGLAALAYGSSRDQFELAVAGQPLDRVQLFAALDPAAAWFNARFEMPWGLREEETAGTRSPRSTERAPYAPQVIVANPGTVTLVQRMGRRLAYLPTEATPDGPPPAPQGLVRFGRHLAFLARQYRVPGQQIVVDMTSLLARSWITPQTLGERANLAALDAWVQPPAGVDGFTAAAQREGVSAGPIPVPEFDRGIEALVQRLDEAHKTGDIAAENAVRGELADEYRQLIRPAWELVWNARDREASIPEESRYTPGRWEADRVSYSGHMAWMDGPVQGRRRTRDSVVAAIRGRREAETATAVVAAEEACSDPTLMIDLLLDHKAVEGSVDPFDFDHREVKPGNVRASAAPRFRITTTRPSLVPVGKELWWTDEPASVQVVVEDVQPDATGPGSVLVMKVMSGATRARALRYAPSACFSVLSTQTYGGGYQPMAQIPFTHVPETPDPRDGHIEPEADAARASAAAS